MNPEFDLSIVIPVFNASSCLEQLVNEVAKTISAAGKTYEIILVDDGSKDESWEVIKALRFSNPNVKGFLLGRNFGQHKATLCGVAHAKGEWVVTMDDDFEHSPALVLPLVESAKKSKSDLFYGVPMYSEKSVLRSLVSRFYKFMSKVENPDAGKGSSLRVIHHKVAEKMDNHHSHLFFIDEVMLWYTDNVATEKVGFSPSRKAASGYSYPKLFSLSKNVFMISTTMPLKMVKFLGFSVSAVSFIMGLYHFLHKFFFPTQKGYTSIILTILFSAGLIMFCIGIIGEYLGNLLIMQNKKPGYSIREQI
jgi:polyisoprenyl-phosphate glycosyltransferase